MEGEERSGAVAGHLDDIKMFTKSRSTSFNSVNSVSVDDDECSYDLRKRVREERKRSTQEQIKGMLERQRRSDVRKKREPYVNMAIAAVAVTAVCYLAYHFFWNTDQNQQP